MYSNEYAYLQLQISLEIIKETQMKAKVIYKEFVLSTTKS